MTSPKDEERFRKNYTELSENECWVWESGTSHGYGKFSLRSKDVYAHRVAYFIFYRKDPGPLQVCHSCDNKPCVNPHHLFLGTDQDNMDDMRNKGRMAWGEKHPSHKLSYSQIQEIRAKYATNIYTQNDLAMEYGVSPSHIGRLLSGEHRKEQ